MPAAGGESGGDCRVPHAASAAPRRRRRKRATQMSNDVGNQGNLPAQASQLPPAAVERMREMRGGAGGRRLFTSDLSVNEFLLVREAGFEPLGLVVGTSVYHIGFQYAGLNQSQELGVLSQAMYAARELAMG